MSRPVIDENSVRPINDNWHRNRDEIQAVLRRIEWHQEYVNGMLDLAKITKDSRERGRIAEQIGYSVIEVNCILRPQLEKLVDQ